MDKCETCKFYKEGKCRRFPTYIKRNKDDWCGEHERIFIPIKPGTKTWRTERRHGKTHGI